MMTFMFAISLVITGLAVWLMIRESMRRGIGPKAFAEGRVVDVVEKQDGDGVIYLKRIQFEDAKGQSFEFLDDVGASWPKPRIGQNVRVTYPEGRPEVARVPHMITRVIAFAFAAIAFVAIALLLVREFY